MNFRGGYLMAYVQPTITLNEINQHKVIINHIERSDKTKEEVVNKYNNTPCVYDKSHVCAIKSCSLGKCKRVTERFYARNTIE